MYFLLFVVDCSLTNLDNFWEMVGSVLFKKCMQNAIETVDYHQVSVKKGV